VKHLSFIKVALRELDIISRDKSARMLLVFLPLFIYFFLAFIYQKGALREIPVAVYDGDHSAVSRKVVSFIESSPAMKITRYLSSEDDLKSFFLNHDEHAVFNIPRGFAKDIYRNKTTRLTVYTNSSNIVYGNILYREAAVISTTVSSGIILSRLEHVGINHNEAMGLVMPVITHAKTLYNPWFNYLYYLLPGLMTVLLQMFVFFAATRAFNREINNGTFSQLVKVSNNSALQMLLGKGLAYAAMGMGVIMLISLVFMAFGIPFMHLETELILLFLVLVLVNVFLGFMLSTTLDEEIFALDIAFFYNSPAFVFSGFTFPMFGMPFFNSTYAEFIPYTHFLHAFFKLYQMGTPLRYIFPEMKILGLFLLVGFVTSWVALKVRLHDKKPVRQEPVWEGAL
jgi:ABC-2 type transport system permease protein